MLRIAAAGAKLLVTALTTGRAQEPVVRTFRSGAMAARTAEVTGYCRHRGGEAVLPGIDRLGSPEGASHRARFACGGEAASEVPIAYRAEEAARIRTDLDECCRARNTSEAKYTAGPAVSASILRGTFRCG